MPDLASLTLAALRAGSWRATLGFKVMSVRSRFLVLLLLVLTFSFAASADRRRAVRARTSDCTFSLSAAFPDPIPPGGMMRGTVNVTGSAPQCTDWAAYSDVSWVTIEQSGSTALVTVLPNETVEVRMARIRVAGVTFQITQLQKEDSGPISPPTPTNLLANATFDLDLRAWGWLDRFPNGSGDATWSNLDANANVSSGSMRLRDDLASGPAFQQLQCINVNGSATYEFGAAVRSASRNGARPVFALVEYDAPNCAGNYPNRYPVYDTRVATANVWERRNYTHTIAPTAQSLSLILGGWARETGVQEVWFDDTYLRVATQ
ncbi:MAG TPA: BACON domain-containing carbohydrate-binding protein [Thermoanaerobaculia bacterium]